jgi:hypothetical protein
MKNVTIRMSAPAVMASLLALACGEVDDFYFETAAGSGGSVGDSDPDPGGSSGVSEPEPDAGTSNDDEVCDGPAPAVPTATRGVRDDAYCIDCSDFPQEDCTSRALDTVEGITPPGDIIFSGKLVYGLAASDSELFFTQYGAYNRNGYSTSADGSLHAVPLSGGTVTEVHSAVPGPTQLSVGAQGTLITTEGMDTLGHVARELWTLDAQMNVIHLRPSNVWRHEPVPFATNGITDFYIAKAGADDEGKDEIYALSAGGNSSILADDIEADCIASDEDFVYFSGQLGTYRVPVDGSAGPEALSLLAARQLVIEEDTLWATSKTDLYSMSVGGTDDFDPRARFSDELRTLAIHGDRFFLSVATDDGDYVLRSGLLAEPAQTSPIGDEAFIMSQAPWVITDEGLFYVYADKVYHVPHDEFMGMLGE